MKMLNTKRMLVGVSITIVVSILQGFLWAMFVTSPFAATVGAFFTAMFLGGIGSMFTILWAKHWI